MRQDEFQKARRISRAIQEYLETTGSNGIRSTDLYPYLARKGVIEKDLNNGLKFRKFLKRLYTQGVLTSVIPQCKPVESPSSNIFMEWYFYSVPSKTKNFSKRTVEYSKKDFSEIMSDDEADSIINKLKFTIEKLPKKPSSDFTPNEKNIRELYPRAYEIWSKRELEIAEIVWNVTKKIDKVAKLLKRQPSAVEKRLKSRGVL